MDVQIDTTALSAGKYTLLIAQQDGHSHAVGVEVLPPTPRFDNLPILVNEGVSAQHYVLKGERLDLLAKLTVPNATIELGNAPAGGTERDVVVRLGVQPAANAGSALPIESGIKRPGAKCFR